MMTFTFEEQEVKTILELAKSARKTLEVFHSAKGICKYCRLEAALHYWPNGTCPGQSLWAGNQEHFSPSEKLVTKYDSIIVKLETVG